MQKCLISPDEVENWPIGPGLMIFDCGFDLSNPEAGREAYLAGHLPGARYLHLDRDLASAPSGSNGRHPLPDPEALSETLRTFGLNRDDFVVTYDTSGGPFAARAWWLLRWLGHERVAVLNGGKQAWQAAGLPLEAGEPENAAPGDFEAAQPDRTMTVDAEGVLAGIGTSKHLILDARSANRFRGEANPLDPVPGRIPGAANRFYGDNLGEDGRFKPAALLADEFASVLSGTAPTSVILQCGSGVTACHNALAMEAAGLAGAKLYSGSWSEWTLDPQRPIERG